MGAGWAIYHRAEGFLRPSPILSGVRVSSILSLLVLVSVSQAALAFQRSAGTTGGVGGNYGAGPGRTGSAVNYSPYPPGWGLGRFPDSSEATVGQTRTSARRTTCDFDPYPTTQNTVSVETLRIPEKAQAEYQSACEALASKNLSKSEEHLRKALRVYPNYARGWVTLGRELLLSEKFDEAENACAQGATINPNSWQAAICLSEIAGREQKWVESLAQGERAVALQPESKNYAYFFDAVALLHLNQLALAEQRAVEAARLDRDHQQPNLQLLLAEIYGAKGDETAEANQLREFLKYAKNSPEIDHAKKELARLENSPN
jgi:tetratricopeptide (TPR) repeat protein